VNETSRLVPLAALALAVACTPQKPTETDAAPSAVPVAPLDAAPSSSAAPMDAHAHMEHWDEARTSALRIPCRAIAVDGPVRAEGSGDAGGPLPFQGEIPDENWLTLGKDARLVAKDPRTTRETTFVGPARARACVAHREESWLVAGRFESAIGAGETPGAEEWVVTPLGVVRYMAAKVAVEVRARDTAVWVGSGPAFMWLDAGVRVTRARGASATDAGALADAAVGPTVDDDGWLRMAEGEVTLSPGPARSPADDARATVDGCAGLATRAQQLAAALLEGKATADGTTAKEQMRTRRLARAACAVAALRVDTLPPSTQRSVLSTRLQSAASAWAVPPALPAEP
jgi:hypothetical protein